MSLGTPENSAIQKLSIIIMSNVPVEMSYIWKNKYNSDSKALCVCVCVCVCVRACVRACVCVCVRLM